jgi:hypothetical protein
LGLIKIQTNSLNDEFTKKVFDKNNLKLLYDCVKKHKIQSNCEYGGQFIYMISNLIENREYRDIIQDLFDIKIIDLFLEELDSRKIEENILKSLFLFCLTITENHVNYMLTESQVKLNTYKFYFILFFNLS